MATVEEKALRNREDKKVLVYFGKSPDKRDFYDKHIVIGNNKVLKNHTPSQFPFSEGEVVDKISMKEFFVTPKHLKDAEGVILINDVTKEKIVSELKAMFIHRYGTKLDGDPARYVPKRKSYKFEDCIEDLEFVLNHLKK
jgi:hypothetical protein